jgi:hypothetical protein
VLYAEVPFHRICDHCAVGFSKEVSWNSSTCHFSLSVVSKISINGVLPHITVQLQHS